MKLKNSEQGSFITSFAYFWIFVVVVGTIGYVLWTNKQVSLNAGPEPETSTTFDPKYDINRDGKVSQVDKNFITEQLNCTKDESCWTTQIGKTSDGDNPIYTSDLDLNKDGRITETDLPQ